MCFNVAQNNPYEKIKMAEEMIFLHFRQNDRWSGGRRSNSWRRARREKSRADKSLRPCPRGGIDLRAAALIRRSGGSRQTR
ncbi:hypothetical protein, partial [Oscillibacter sp.]|uniref:hypothetical protein n=1 Tax=Oscillibacter sp. TaxID=1945593 RepID=UPI0028B081D5